MEMRKESGGPGSTTVAADASSPGEPCSSADVDVGRLKTRVPFNVEEIDLLLGTVPFHLLRCSELEQKFGKEAFQSWYDEAAKNKKTYLAKYPDIYSSSGKNQKFPESSDTKESVDYESLAFETMCDSIPAIIHAYNEVHLEEDEIGCDVTKEAVERSKVEYKRLNELMNTFGTPPPRLEGVNFWTDSKEQHNPKKLEDWVHSEADWEEFSLEVQREVDIVKAMCTDEQYNPIVRKPLTWLDQFVGAIEKETGIPFDKDFAEHMADLAAGKDSDISVNAHARSLGAENLADSDDSADESIMTLPARTVPPTNARETLIKKEPPIKKEPDRPISSDNLDEHPSLEEPYNLEKELQSYVGRKKRFLLSQVHDDGVIKWKKGREESTAEQDVPYLEAEEWYFGPKEFIVLRDEGGKKTRTDIVVDREEELSEKIAVIQETPAKKRARLMSTRNADKNYFLKLLLTPRYLKELGIDTGESDEVGHEELCLNTQPTARPKPEILCEVLEPTEEDREKRLQRRKLFRWEKFQFRDYPELTEAAPESTIAADSSPIIKEASQTKNSADSRAVRRRKIADSLFQDDSKKYVEYVDPSEMTGWELRRPLPIINSANLCRGYIPEVFSPPSAPESFKSKNEKFLPEQSIKIPEESNAQSTLLGEKNVPSVTSASIRPTKLVPTRADPALTISDIPVSKKDNVGSKKDRKKKKRKSSSSSDDDLEMLEKKSEARLRT